MTQTHSMELPIKPLLAQAPEKSPPLRWWLFLLPVLMALLGIFLANAAAIQGQTNARRLAQAQLEYRQVFLAHQIRKANDRGDVEKAAALQPLLEQANKASIISYLRPGRHFTHWDAYRYEEIINEGYIYRPGPESVIPIPGRAEGRLKNVVWYPLYPLLGTIVSKITGLPAHQALNLVSQASIIAASVVLFALARRHFYNRIPDIGLAGAAHLSRRWDLNPVDTAALWTLAFVLFSPCAIFLYANYTEALFVLLLASFLFCIQGRKWWQGALIAALASATRSQGVLFGPVLALTYLLRSEAGPLNKRILIAFVLGLISALGIISYMIYLYWHVGDPLAFMSGQRFWNVGINARTITYALNPVHAMENFLHFTLLRPMDWPHLWEAACVMLPPVLLMLLGARFLSFEQELMAWILWGLPFVSNSLAASSPTAQHWMSMGRFMAVVIPLQIIVGAVLVRFRWLSPPLLAASAAFFMLFAYLFGAGIWIG